MSDWLTFWPLVIVAIVGAIGGGVIWFALWLEQFTRRGFAPWEHHQK